MSKKRKAVEQVAAVSADLVAERRQQLAALFPEAFSEGKVDFTKLRNALGDLVDDSPERYSFTWAGKRDAIRLLQVPSRATLVPCPDESVNFDTTQHLFIEGDNLEVLKLLYKSYAGRVKMIYIDPPYNTGNDFIYPDNFADPLDTYLRLTGQKDAQGNLLTSNPETSGRYHSAWLSMMYPRLFVARQLLREDGVIFVSIDDTEVSNLRALLNEVFGEENLLAHIVWQKKYTRNNDATYFSDNHDHILAFCRCKQHFSLRRLARTDKQDDAYRNPDDDPGGPWKLTPLQAKSGNGEPFSHTFPNGIVWSPPPGRYSAYSHESLDRMYQDDELWFGEDCKSVPQRKTYLRNVGGLVPLTIWPYDEVGHNHEANDEMKRVFGEQVFDNPKPTRLLKRMIEITTEDLPSDIIMDFFAGSGTTAHAVLARNREVAGQAKFILVQLPEALAQPKQLDAHTRFDTIADIARERIRRVVSSLVREQQGSLGLKQEGEEPEDLGFRSFKLAETHYRRWRGVEDKKPDALADEMAMFTDPLVPGWEAIDVVYEVLLKEGLSLTSRIEKLPKKIVKKNTVYRVTDDERGQSLLICLDDRLAPGTLKALALGKVDILVCRDAALTDELAANLALQCRLKTI